MRSPLRFALALFALAFAGCSSAEKYAPSSRQAETISAPAPRLDTSVFAEDKAVISDDELNKILDSEVLIPEDSRIAVHRLGALPRQMIGSRQRFQFDVGMTRSLVGKLKDLPRVRNVSMLPTLVVPQILTIPHLRKAAARCQSELLLVYRVSSESYQRTHVFASDETWAYCMVEAMLIHVRTGLIIWSSLATEDFSATKSDDDLNFRETVSKAQLKAFSQVMETVGDALAEHLKVDS